jgi:alanine racemase
MPRPIRATISAGALERNLHIAKAHAKGAKVWAVIKANAYGHGLERAARAFAAADGFAVLDFQEAARLRLAGVKADPDAGGLLQAADIPLIHKYA